MAVVPLDQVWVDANFKEPQLAHMRVGQPVTLTADLYGNKIRYHGTVAGFGAGTGSAFSLLPAQNATGNWIKIVQRVPVRIVLDAREVAMHPLQIGLSMKADVDVSKGTDGARLPQLASNATSWSTDVYGSGNAQADARARSSPRTRRRLLTWQPVARGGTPEYWRTTPGCRPAAGTCSRRPRERAGGAPWRIRLLTDR
jgi:membrane fusion protein (multidrug efflux system)